MSYKLIKSPDTGKTLDYIWRKSDGSTIPKDPANTDYAEYLEWVAAGNTPEAAD